MADSRPPGGVLRPPNVQVAGDESEELLPLHTPTCLYDDQDTSGPWGDDPHDDNEWYEDESTAEHHLELIRLIPQLAAYTQTHPQYANRAVVLYVSGESIDCVEVTEGDIRKVSLHYGPICAVERIAPHCYVIVYETESAASCANDGFNERIEHSLPAIDMHCHLLSKLTSPPPPPPPPHTEDTAHSQQQQEQQQVPLLPTPNVPAYPLTSSHPIYGAQQQQQQHFGGPGPTSPTNLGSPSSYAHHPGSRVSGPPHPQPHPHGHPHAPHLHRRGGKEWIPVPRSVAREADGYPVLNLAKEHEFPSPALRKYTARFEVGIENEREFTVARRIIGNKGSHMRAVWEMTKAKLRLRGRGSGYYEGSQQTECPEPLHLCISCRTYDGYVLAMRMVADLLLRIHDDYREWCAIQGRPVPNLQLRYREHPLDRRSSNINASKKADNNRERQPHAPAPSVSVSVTSPSGASASPWCNPDHFGGLMSSYLQRGESTEGGEATRPYTHHNEIGFPLHMHSTDDRTPYNRR